MSEFEERRRSPRIEMDIKLPGLGQVQNISADGMWLLTENPVSGGILLNLEFQLLPETPLITCKGEVIWSGRRKMADGRTEIGLKFVDLAESDRKIILDYVESQHRR